MIKVGKIDVVAVKVVITKEYRQVALIRECSEFISDRGGPNMPESLSLANWKVHESYDW